jgi:hypothetical protein
MREVSVADTTTVLVRGYFIGCFKNLRLRVFSKCSCVRICLPIQGLVQHEMAHFLSLGLTSLLKLVVFITRHPSQILASHPIYGKLYFQRRLARRPGSTRSLILERTGLSKLRNKSQRTTPGSTRDWDTSTAFLRK